MNILDTSEQTQITLDGSTLIYGKYSVQGQDLLITTEFDSVLLKDYFEHLPTLVSPQGSKLTPKLVSLLSAYQPNDYLGFEDPQAIGEITLTGGPITVTRAGQQIQLSVGDYIYLNDLVEAGEYNVGITFKDDTALSLEAGARMVIDDFVYDPDTPTEGSMNANVLGGGFSFVSGNVAKVGADAMTVTTPVLTIGVRGTQVAGRANQDGEDNEIILLPNEDGTVGQILVSNESGSVLLTEAFQGTTITSAVVAPSIPVIIPEDIVLKKFAKTIATNKTTLKTSKKNKQSKEAEKEKKKLEKEKEELEQEKEQLEEEAEQLEEEKAELEEKLADEDITEEEKAQLEEELAAVEEKVVAVEEKVEQVVEQAEQVEQKFEQVEQQIQQIEKEFEQFFEEIKEEFGEEVVADVEQAVAEAEKVFEEKIQEEVAKEVEAEIKEEEKIEDPFEEAPEEEMDQQMEQKVEEEIQQLEEEIQQLEEEPIVEEAIEEDIFKDEGMMNEEDKMEEVKIEEEIKEFETELAKEEPIMDNNFVAFEEPNMDEPVDDYVVEQFEPAPQLDVMEEEFVYEEPVQEEQQDAEPVDYAPTASADAVTVSETISDGASVATVTGNDAGGDTLTYSIVSGNDGGLFQIDASTGEITYVKDVTQLATEDFENLSDGATPTGWQGSQAKIKNTTYDTGVLGRIGNDTSGNQLVYKTFDVGTQYANKRIKIDFTFHEYGSWDADQWGNTDEYFRAWVNDDMKINDLRQGGQSNHDMKYGSKVGGSKKGWNKIKKNEGMAIVNNYQESDQYSMYGKVQNDGTVKIGFGAILAESINNESFGVDNIKVRLAGLDYEDVNQHTLTVRVSDGNQYVEVDQVINVSDGNDAPIFDEGRSAISIAENGSSGEQVQVVKATDADDDTMTYSIIDGNTGNKFAIDSSTGIITTTGALDYETTTSYTLTIKAEDPDGASATTTQVVNVTNDTGDDVTIHENVLDFEDVHSSNDGGEIAYKLDIGYYQMDLGYGDATNQGRIIRQTGHNYHSLADVGASSLQGKDIVYVHNGNNSGFGAEWRSGTGQASDSSASDPNSAIWSWVDDGGILLIQDRHVTNANAMLLGESATITRSVLNGTNDDTDFRTELNDTLLYNGAAGTLTNNTLDGGNHTDHGYITNLGTGEVGIGHRGTNNPTPRGEDYYNAFAYKYGSGLVYYDTYPMDLWDGYGVSNTYSASSTLTSGGAQTYNENLIQWAASLYYDGASQINGTDGSETILGTMGDDVIFGGFGGDTLWGGDGADTFVYTNTNQTQPSQPDHIQDFDSSEDSIDISAITSGASVSRTLTNNTQFKLDTDNNGTYEMEFNLVGYTGTADDVTVVT